MSDLWHPNGIKETSDEVHKAYLKLAYQFAWDNSDDPVTKIGALILKRDQVLAYGTNRLPAGVIKTPGRLERPKKYSYLEHAEREAIFTAAKMGISTDFSTIYMPWAPCNDCARAMIGAGISKLVSHKPMIEKTPEHWYKSIDEAIEMLQEAGLELLMYNGKLGSVKALINRVVWEP